MVNKSVHIAVLFTFAIAFIVVYLYYTINDVKKISTEVKKHGVELEGVLKILDTYTKELNDLKRRQTIPVFHPAFMEPHGPPPPTTHKDQVQVIQVHDPTQDDEGDHDEPIEDMPGLEHVEEEEEEEEEVEDQNTDLKDLGVEALKEKNYEDLRQYCKSVGLSTKGNKEALISRIKAL